ncbi:hypothetical protein CJ023_29735 [Pseudomonas aeruginosa]|nr:hypothetical protein CJ023_29735 [Pseudomonas aeruginosa]
MSQFRPCPACRGYDLERRWCHVCDGRGVVDVEAQQKERAEMGWRKPEIEWGGREDDQEGWKRLKENDRA